MNKKLRRILRRRRTNNTDDVTNKKQRDLPALLSEREKAEPNYYLSNDQSSNNHNAADDKDPKAEDLIVNTEPTDLKQGDIEITLEEVKYECSDRIPNDSNPFRSSPNSTEIQRSGDSANKSKPNALFESRNEVNHSKCKLHNNSRRLTRAEASSMQNDRLALAFSRAARCDNITSEAVDEDDWGVRCDRDFPFTHCQNASKSFRMKRLRDERMNQISQCDADWGWVTLPRNDESSSGNCGFCDHLPALNTRCTVTSQRGRDRWSPWKTCRCASTSCRGRRHACGTARDLPNNSRTTSSHTRRFRTSTAVLFTIVDEDALERRPRVLEFGRSLVTEQPLPPQHQRQHHHQHHRDALHAHRCHEDGACNISMRSDGMDCNEDFEETNGDHHSNHCLAVATINNNCLQVKNVNALSTSQSSPTTSSGMGPSIAFLSGTDTSTVGARQQIHSSFCHCNCRARTMTSRPKTSHHNPFDKRMSDEEWLEQDDFGLEATTSFEHFELSKRAYARLIAYCHSKKLLADIYTNSGLEDGQCDFVSATDSSGSSDDNAPSSSFAGFSDSNPGASDFVSASAFDSAQTLCHLAQVFETVDECPWYCGAMTGQEAKMRLRGTPPGTFLLRDSSDSRFLFSMSLMTRRGATSIRIVYAKGRFGFDSEDDDSSSRKSSSAHSRRARSDRTKCIIRMILHYTSYLTSKNSSIENARDAPSSGSERSPSETSRSASGPDRKRQFLCYSVDRGTRKEVPIQLVQPISGGVHSLQFISRACLNRRYRLWENPALISSLPLPYVMKNYVRKYPYPV